MLRTSYFSHGEALKTLNERRKIRAEDPLGLRAETAAFATRRTMQGDMIQDGETVMTFRHEVQRHKERLAKWKGLGLNFTAKVQREQDAVNQITLKNKCLK